MKLRWGLALAATLVTGLLPIAAVWPQNSSLQQMESLTVPELGSPKGIQEAYRAANGVSFGNPCRICPNDPVQGAYVDDCYLLSPMSALAIASPGTIQADIQTAPLGSYLVTLYPSGVKTKDPIRVDATFPAMTLSGTGTAIESAFQDLAPSLGLKLLGQYLTTLARSTVMSNQNDFVYAQPPSQGSLTSELKGSNGVIWPMILEKAYASTNEKKTGYGWWDDHGASPYTAMIALTGQPGGGWYVSPVANDLLISAWVHESPIVPDTGDHSVLGGLTRQILQGGLNAESLKKGIRSIEPNLQICAAAQGVTEGKCTPVCPETHECQQKFPEPGVPLNATQKNAEIRVYDVDLRDRGNPNPRRTLLGSLTVNPDNCPDPKQQSAGATGAAPTTPATPAPPVQVPAGCSVQTPNGTLAITFQTSHAALGKTSIAEATFKVTDTQPHPSQLTTVTELATVFSELQQAKLPVVVGTTDNCAGRTAICEQDFQSGKLERDSEHMNGHAYYLKQYNPAAMTVTAGNPHGSEDVTLPLDEFLQTFTEIVFDTVKGSQSNCGCN